MSLLGKYRKEADKDEDVEDVEEVEKKVEKTKEKKTKKKPHEKPTKAKGTEAVPNSERRSPIVSFSVTMELRESLQAVREEHAINLSMWVERRLREAIVEHYPKIARRHLE